MLKLLSFVFFLSTVSGRLHTDLARELAEGKTEFQVNGFNVVITGNGNVPKFVFYKDGGSKYKVFFNKMFEEKNGTKVGKSNVALASVKNWTMGVDGNETFWINGTHSRFDLLAFKNEIQSDNMVKFSVILNGYQWEDSESDNLALMWKMGNSTGGDDGDDGDSGDERNRFLVEDNSTKPATQTEDAVCFYGAEGSPDTEEVCFTTETTANVTAENGTETVIDVEIDYDQTEGVVLRYEKFDGDLYHDPEYKIDTTAGGGSSGGDTGGSDGPPCFSAVNTVEVEGKGFISMDSLKIGDKVRAGKNEFSTVYSFLHLDHDIQADFLQVHAEGLKTPLEITPDHMLFVESALFPVPASQVKIGDKVMREHKVSDIKLVKRRGVFAPATESGEIVVSGMLASSYADLLPHSFVNQHYGAHAFFGLRRLVCTFDFEICENETYTETGIPEWLSLAAQVATSTRDSAVAQTLLSVVGLPVLAAAVMLEKIILNGPLIVGMILFGVLAIKKTKSNKSKAL